MFLNKMIGGLKLFSIKEEKKHIKIMLGIMCSLYFIICVYSIFKYRNSTLLGSLLKPDNDDVKFIRSAWILKDTGKYIYHNPSSSTVFMMPGLSFTLAFFVKIFGRYGGITALRVFHAVLQTASMYLIFLISRKIFNSKVGLVAILISCLSISEYWLPNLVLTETIFKFFTLLLIYFSIYAIEEKKTKYYILGGIALGLGTLFRPAITTFPIVILIMWLIHKYKFKEMLKYGAIVVGIFCIILSPWWIRNYYDFHRFIPLTLATGNPMLQGTYINYDQSSKATDGLNYNKYPYPSKPSEIGNNRTEMNIAKYRIRELMPKEPMKYLRWYTIGKANNQVKSPYFDKDGFLGVSIWRAQQVHSLTWKLCLVGVLGYFTNKKRNRMGIFILFTIIYFVIAYLPFMGMARYFYPSMPYVTIFAAVGVVFIYEILRALASHLRLNFNKHTVKS